MPGPEEDVGSSDVPVVTSEVVGSTPLLEMESAEVESAELAIPPEKPSVDAGVAVHPHAANTRLHAFRHHRGSTNRPYQA